MTRADTPTCGLIIVMGLSDRVLASEIPSRGNSSRGTAGRAEYEVVVCTTGVAEAAEGGKVSESSKRSLLSFPLRSPILFRAPLTINIVVRPYSCGVRALYTRARQMKMPKMTLYCAIKSASRLAQYSFRPLDGVGMCMATPQAIVPSVPAFFLLLSVPVGGQLRRWIRSIVSFQRCWRHALHGRHWRQGWHPRA
jgi:hypothetical protein